MQTASEASPKRMNHIASKIALLLILLLSACLQFTAVARTEAYNPLGADALDYFLSAYNLDHYGVYSRTVTFPQEDHLQAPPPDAVRSPGYPLFLRLLGHPEPSLNYIGRVMLVQAALGVASVWMMYLIATRFLRRRWACLAALLTAISPHLIVISTYLLTESLFFFLLLASTLGLLKAIESAKPTHWSFVLVGLLWGLCSLVRPTVEFIPVLVLLAAIAIPRLKQFRATAMLLFLGFAVVLAPWLIRNATLPPQDNQPSLMIQFLLHGSYPNFLYQNNPATYGDPYRWDPSVDQIGRSLPKVLTHIAHNFKDDPLTYARWYLIGKPGFFLSWTNLESWTNPDGGDIYIYPVKRSPFRDDQRFVLIRNLAYVLHWPLMLLGLAGACLPWWRPQRWELSGASLFATRLLSLILLYAIGFHMIGAPFPRYGIPFRPLLYPLALMAVLAPWRSRDAQPDA
jgi:4-amino-4-deoxy-L-arabinose transferase-like glycosyltransferase